MIPLSHYDKKVLTWFTTLSLNQIDDLCVKHFKGQKNIKMNGFIATILYQKENEKSS